MVCARRVEHRKPLDTMLPLTELAPGSYQLELSAKVGGQTARRIVPFSVR
jgi:hypothetical protein